MPAHTDIPAFARDWANLASARLGAAAVEASDDFFADKSRLLSDAPPVFVPDKYDDHGKWMDGWETRRRRSPGHDYCVVRLATRGILHGVDIDTTHFTGNYPQAASIDIRLAGETDWREILPAVDLGGDRHHYLALDGAGPADELRLNIYPDGGIARLRVYGAAAYDWSAVAPDREIELSAFVHGGRIVAYNDAHFGPPWPILTAGRGRDMGDGWETRRRRTPGHDWLVVALGHAGIVERVEVDTAHFKGNYPAACSLQATLTGGQSLAWEAAGAWPELMGRQELGPDALHHFDGSALRDLGPVDAVRLNIFPDGGISRLRLIGRKA